MCSIRRSSVRDHESIALLDTLQTRGDLRDYTTNYSVLTRAGNLSV
jgi:hypothetical protein